jgi:zinc transporter 2
MSKDTKFELELADEPSNKPEEDHSSESSEEHPNEQGQSQLVIKKLLSICGICLLFMAVEIIGGLVAQSIAIISDAVHLLSDLSGFIISIVSLWIAQKNPTKAYTYGYHRAGVIGALINVLIIWLLVGMLIYEAVWRLLNLDKVEVEGKIMFYTSCFGLVCNLIMAKVLHSHDGHGHGHAHHHHHGHDHTHAHGHEHEHGSCSHNHHSHNHEHAHSHEEKHKDKKIKDAHHHDHKHNEEDHAREHIHTPQKLAPSISTESEKGSFQIAEGIVTINFTKFC